MYVPLISLLLLGGSYLSGVSAYGNGAPSGTCASMAPSHRTNEPMTSTPPYWVASDEKTFIAGQKITVTLHANETAFTGFLLEARYAEAGDEAIGTFSLTGDESKLVNCTEGITAVTHTSKSQKKTIQAVWIPPSNVDKDIEFRATFVQMYSTFWVGVKSNRVVFNGGSPSLSYSLPLFGLPLVLLAFSSLH